MKEVIKPVYLAYSDYVGSQRITTETGIQSGDKVQVIIAGPDRFASLVFFRHGRSLDLSDYERDSSGGYVFDTQAFIRDEADLERFLSTVCFSSNLVALRCSEEHKGNWRCYQYRFATYESSHCRLWRRILVVACVFAAFLLGIVWKANAQGTTDLFRHEVAFVSGSPIELYQSWWVHTAKRWESQAYYHYERSSGNWRQVNFAAGPVLRVKGITVVFPVGVRFRPEDNWRFSQVIGKVIAKGRLGEHDAWPFLAVNDLSFGVGGAKNEHFFDYQLSWMPKDKRVGVGVKTDAVYVGSVEKTWKAGPVIKLIYARSGERSPPSQSSGEARWDWTLDIFPFYDITHGSIGVKFNFLTFRFGRGP